MEVAWGSSENSRPRGKSRRETETFAESQKEKNNGTHAVQMATQLIATVAHKQNDICLRKCRQTKTRAQYTTTSHQASLISTHPGFLSLALIHSLLKRQRWTRAQAHTHAHRPIFHPKIHEGKSLSSSPSHYFPSTLWGTIPSSVPARPLKSFCVFWQTIFPSLHRPHPWFSLASAQSGCASPLWH